MPSVYNNDAAITDWTDFSMSITSSGTSPTKGTNPIEVAKWRRLGDSMEVSYFLQVGTSPSAGTGSYIFNLPSGYTIDSNKLRASGSIGATALGEATCSATNNSMGVVTYSTSTGVTILFQSTATTVAVIGATFNPFTAGFTYAFKCLVHIVGWTSNAQ